LFLRHSLGVDDVKGMGRSGKMNWGYYLE